MLKLLALLLLAPAQAPTQSIGESNFKFRDPAGGVTPVTDKTLIPMKAPDCRNEAEIQLALEQLSHGERGHCFIRDIRRLSRR